MTGTDYDVEFPYAHSTGAALSRFLTALRDDRVILGRRCEACARVVVPPEEHCDTCGSALGTWVEVGPEGVVIGLTVVHEPAPPQPAGAPFAFVRVRLDGAGTDLVHIGAATVRLGDRVAAVWAAERSGSIRDIAGFAVVP